MPSPGEVTHARPGRISPEWGMEQPPASAYAGGVRRSHALLALAFLVVEPARAQLVVEPSEYDCTIIASTDQFPEGLLGPPTMNASGRVAFLARVAGQGPSFEIHTGVGDTDAGGVPITGAIARSGPPTDPDAFFASIEGPVIENQGRVFWLGSEQPSSGPPVIGIYRKRSDAPLFVDPSPRVQTGDGNPLNPLVALRQGPTGNSSGTMLYIARRQNDVGDALFRGPGSVGSVIAMANGPEYQTLGAFVIDLVQPWYAFLGILPDGVDQRLRLNLTTVETVATDQGEFLSGISISGNAIATTAYVRSAGRDWQLRRATALGFATLVDSTLDTTGASTSPAQTSINAFGEVVAGGGPGEPLLFADGSVLREVVCRDMLATFGTVVFPRLEISPRAINSDGEIAFRAETGSVVLSTGADEAFIVRATPFQHPRPAVCTGLPDGAFCDDLDPETIAFCAADTCVPEPVPEPRSPVGHAAVFAAIAALAWSRRRRAQEAQTGTSVSRLVRSRTKRCICSPGMGSPSAKP